jgi:DDE family transposase
MPQGRLSFEFEESKEADEKVTAWSGLTLVVEALAALGVAASIRKHLRLFRSRKNLVFDEADQVAALVMLFAAGGDCLEDLRALRDDAGLCRLLGRSLPSPETVRQFLYLFHEDQLVEEAQKALPLEGKAYVPEESEALQALARVQSDLVGELQRRRPASTATLDVDTTFQESHKREAHFHYQSGPGYQPLLATWAEQRLVVFDQFRDGNVPGQFDVVRSLQRAFAGLPAGVEHRRLRADSAFYVVHALRWLCQEKIGFAIGARMYPALRDACAALPEGNWQLLQTRPDSVLHVSEVEHSPKGWTQHDERLRYLAIRLTPVQNELFDGDRTTQFLAIVTNRTGPAADLVQWYWDKGGTIEHVHDILKNELGAGVFPCGRFGANAAWLRINSLTFNLLEAVRRVAPPELKDARPKRLRLLLFAIPALVVSHARQLLARVVARGSLLLPLRNALWAPLPT